MSDNNKVTVRFESTGEITDNSTPNFLLSGPVEIFATCDEFSELNSKEMKDSVAAAEDNKTIIVYVKDVRNSELNKDDQTHRGAYYIYAGEAADGSLQWQEILLGTHSHRNIDALEAWTDLIASANVPEGGKLIRILPGGKFELADIDDKVLPNLPYDVIEAKAQNEKAKINQPDNIEYTHMDAPLSELTDAYDWDGTHKNNNAIGSCHDVYREIMKMKRKLYIKPTDDKGIQFTEDGDTGDAWVLLFSSDPKDDASIKKEEYDKYRYKLSIKLDSENYLYTNDQILIYNGEELLSDEWILESIDNKNHTLNILIKKSYYDTTSDRDITVLVIRGGNDSIKDTVLSMLENGDETLESINEKLTKIAVEAKLFDEAISPTYYLTLNKNGEYEWSNDLLPNTFYWKKTIPLELEELDGVIEKEFKDIYGYNSEKDTPIVMIDQFFVPDADIIDLGENKIKIRIPYNEIYSQLRGDGSVSMTVLIVRNCAGRSVAEDLANNYVSKKDAVEILSRGKIDLDDYVKKSELRDISHVGHTHSQYSKIGHNHDFRYANFHHTHPEIALTIANLITNGISQEDIDNKFKELQEQDYEAIKGALEEAGIDVDENGQLTINPNKLDLNYNNLIKLVNERLDDARKSENLKNVDDLGSEASLNDILTKIIELFGYDIVNDSQVLLETDLPVKNKLGGIRTDKYKKDTTLQTILRDMLNPFISADENKELMTPDKEKSKIHYYVKNDFGEFVEIDLENLRPEDEGKQLYYKVELKNKNGDDCKSYYINSTGSEVEQKISYKIGDSKTFGYYVLLDETKPIDVIVTSGIIYDNYGLDSTSALDLTISFELPDIHIDYPDFYYGVGNIDISADDLIPVYMKENHELVLTPAVGEYILIFTESADNFSIIDKFFGDITETFDYNGIELIGGANYKKYSYRILAEDVKLKLNIEIDN